jgi:hypothetical protein
MEGIVKVQLHPSKLVTGRLGKLKKSHRMMQHFYTCTGIFKNTLL